MAKVTKSGTVVRKTTTKRPSAFGQRLRELRLSLQTNDRRGKPVPAAAMDRVMGSPTTRHKWQRLEDEGTSDNPVSVSMALFTTQCLSRMLVSDNPAKLEEQLAAYVKGEKPLPWKLGQAPAWNDFQPWRPVGRPRGSVALTTQQFLTPRQGALPEDDPRQANAAPVVPVEQTNPVIVAILNGIQSGEMPIEAAVVALRTLLAGACWQSKPVVAAPRSHSGPNVS